MFHITSNQASDLIKAITIAFYCINTTEKDMTTSEVDRLHDLRNDLELWLDTLQSRANDVYHQDVKDLYA